MAATESGSSPPSDDDDGHTRIPMWPRCVRFMIESASAATPKPAYYEERKTYLKNVVELISSKVSEDQTTELCQIPWLAPRKWKMLEEYAKPTGAAGVNDIFKYLASIDREWVTTLRRGIEEPPCVRAGRSDLETEDKSFYILGGIIYTILYGYTQCIRLCLQRNKGMFSPEIEKSMKEFDEFTERYNKNPIEEMAEYTEHSERIWDEYTALIKCASQFDSDIPALMLTTFTYRKHMVV